MNNNFNDTSFSRPMRNNETIHYKGELRIVGQVVNTLSDKEPIGYVIMVEKTMKFKMYTVAQTMSLLQKFKFVNAAIEGGKIINTECAMNRLPMFNTNMNVIGNHGIIILGEIVDGRNTIGYRAMDTSARVVDLSEVELLKLKGNGVQLINAKAVTHQGKEVISAIKTEFTKIEKSKLKTLKPIPRLLTEAQKARYEQHNKKVTRLASGIIEQMFKMGTTSVYFNDHWAWRESNDSYERYYEPLREYQIFCNEIVKDPKYNIGESLSNLDKDILEKVGNLPKQSRLHYAKEKMSDETKEFLVAFLQFALYNKDTYNKVLNKLSRKAYSLKFDAVKKLSEKGLACDALKKLAVELKKQHDEAVERANKLQEAYAQALEATEGRYHKKLRGRGLELTSDKKIFKTKKFTTANEVRQLGFTLFKEEDEASFSTDCGIKELKYIGSEISNDVEVYNKYKETSRCLGDLLSIAYINKILKKLENKEKYIGEERAINSIVTIATIAYMFSSTTMKMYIDNNKDRLLKFIPELPEYDEIANIDYKLDPSLTMYYTSGFNVFLRDKYPHYTSSHIYKSEILNYRQMSIKHIIEHDMLQNDFASAIALVAPNFISGEDISDVIGRLRFL